MFLESSQDLLYIVLALCVLWFTVFLCWLLYQAARVLRNANKIIESVTEKLELRYAKGLAKLSKFYDVAREFGKLVSKGTKGKFVVVTGGGPGIMEAANRGAYESGHRSLGFNITLPHEQEPNNYITPNLAFCFHYFAVRKMHLVIRSRACVIFPGGSGTLDEFFEIFVALNV